MVAKKINDDELLYLIDIEGLSQSKAAKQLKVSRQAVFQRLAYLKRKTTHVLVANNERADRVINRRLNVAAQLVKINEHANGILDRLIIDGKKAGSKGSEEFHDLALKTMAEIRLQLRLQMDIYQSLFDAEAVKEFQEAILESIAEVAPDVRNSILQKLNQKRAIRSAVQFG